MDVGPLFDELHGARILWWDDQCCFFRLGKLEACFTTYALPFEHENWNFRRLGSIIKFLGDVER